MNKKKNLYTLSALVLLSITLVLAIIRYTFFTQNSFINYSTREICIWLVFPLFVVMLSLVFSKMIHLISTQQVSSLDEPTPSERNFKNNIWRHAFIFTLINALIFLFTPIIYYFQNGNTLVLSQSYKSLNGIDYLVISVLTGYTFGLLYNLLSRKKKQYILLLLLLSISCFLMGLLILVNINTSAEDEEMTSMEEYDYEEYDDEEYNDATRVREVGEITYEEEQAIKRTDSIEALKYNFYDQDLTSVSCSAYFADLWEDPSQDKDLTQYAFLNYISDYLNVQKYKSVADYVDNISYESGYDKLNNQSLIIISAFRKNEKVLTSAFKSYKKLIYLVFSDEIYQESGLRNLTKLLLKTHEELYTNPSKLDEIYNIMTLNQDEFHYGRNSYFVDLKRYISNDIIKSLQSEENFDFYKNDLSSIDSYTKGEAVWLYSFWARRYKENNDKAVFKILKEIDEHYQ